MCDYSLHNVASRPAKLGDELVTAKFANTITQGFSAIGEPNVAVCLLPGTELAFEKEAEYEHPFARLIPRLRFGKIGERVARFRQVDAHRSDRHHDALEFANGKIVLLTRLCRGQRATVLQLPVRAHPAKEQTEQKPVVLIACREAAERQ
jgi:hypothetical protein